MINELRTYFAGSDCCLITATSTCRPQIISQEVMLHKTPQTPRRCGKHSSRLREGLLRRQSHQGGPASFDHRRQKDVWLREHVRLPGEAGREAEAQPHLAQELQADVLGADAQEGRPPGAPGNCSPVRQSAGAHADPLMSSPCAVSWLRCWTHDAIKTASAVCSTLAPTRQASGVLQDCKAPPIEHRHLHSLLSCSASMSFSLAFHAMRCQAKCSSLPHCTNFQG